MRRLDLGFQKKRSSISFARIPSSTHVKTILTFPITSLNVTVKQTRSRSKNRATGLVALGAISGGTDLASAFKNAYNLTAQQAAAILKSLGKLLGGAAQALAGLAIQLIKQHMP
jgi:hypothetical protein